MLFFLYIVPVLLPVLLPDGDSEEDSESDGDDDGDEAVNLLARQSSVEQRTTGIDKRNLFITWTLRRLGGVEQRD